MYLKKVTIFIIAVLLLFGTVAQAGSMSTAATSQNHTLDDETTKKTNMQTPEQAGPIFAKGNDENIVQDEDSGHWLYRSSTLSIEVNRIFDEEDVQTYYAAEVYLKPGEEMERSGYGRPEKPGVSALELYKITEIYDAVLAVNGDFMRRNDLDKKGIIIRDGKVFHKGKEEDTLAFYPDGTMRIIHPGDKKADELLAEGVVNTYSFGPTLIEDSEINPDLDKHRLRRRHPRTAVGMIEPYHYLVVLVDGRQDGYSVGMKLTELAELFAEYGCTVAYNLDGGASATMAFMGKNISIYEGSHTGQRIVPDALMFGFSPKLSPEEHHKKNVLIGEGTPRLGSWFSAAEEK